MERELLRLDVRAVLAPLRVTDAQNLASDALEQQRATMRCAEASTSLYIEGRPPPARGVGDAG